MGELGGGTRVFGQFGDERGVLSIGKKHHPLRDLYHGLLTASWWRLFVLFALVYLAVNALFAVPFYFLAEGIENVRRDSFADAFFFSLQNLTATEYRPMAAKTVAVQVLAGVEGFIRWLGLALGAGLIFTKFSRPKPRILFSKVAVVAEHQGVPALMFRMANERSTDIVDAKVKLMLAIDEQAGEGDVVRRVHDLPLWRGDSALFAHTWTAVHHLGPESPLSGRNARSLVDAEAELIVSLTGYDEALSRTIHARQVYPASRVLWGVRFREILVEHSSGRRAIDYRRFHDVVPLEPDGKVERTLRGRARG
jgi:inward rectifier potassium channel